MTVLQMIRFLAPEFSEVSDEELRQNIDIFRPMVSRKQFGNLFKQGLAYFVCHKLKIAGYGENPLGEMGKIGVGFSIGSVSEGGSSISFGAGQSSNLTPDAELGLTIYGVQFLQLRRYVIVPIHISNEKVEVPDCDSDEELY